MYDEGDRGCVQLGKDTTVPPVNSMLEAMASAASLMDTSSSFPTVNRTMSDTYLYNYSPDETAKWRHY